MPDGRDIAYAEALAVQLETDEDARVVYVKLGESDLQFLRERAKGLAFELEVRSGKSCDVPTIPELLYLLVRNYRLDAGEL